MLKSASGIVIIPQQPELQVFLWKDKGAYLSFKAVSQEATQEDKAKLHYYRINIFIPVEEIENWKEKLVPGQMFLLTNGSVSAPILEGKEHPFNTIKVDRNNFCYLKKTVTIGD